MTKPKPKKLVAYGWEDKKNLLEEVIKSFRKAAYENPNVDVMTRAEYKGFRMTIELKKITEI